jgi:hypothetical protein
LSDRQRILDETLAARAKALDLLRALQDAKAATEDPVAPGRDLYKRVTGQSSVENSIAATRRTLEAYDKVIAELREPPMVVVTRQAGPVGSNGGSGGNGGGGGHGGGVNER